MLLAGAGGHWPAGKENRRDASSQQSPVPSDRVAGSVLQPSQHLGSSTGNLPEAVKTASKGHIQAHSSSSHIDKAAQPSSSSSPDAAATNQQKQPLPGKKLHVARSMFACFCTCCLVRIKLHAQ